MRSLKNYSTLACSVLLVLGLSMAAQAQTVYKEEELVGRWTFEKGEELKDVTGNFPDLELNGAEVKDGALDVSAGLWAVTVGDYGGPDIEEKTLVSWVTLESLNVTAGSVLTLDRIASDHFDGIVYSERQVHRWMSGSSNFGRTQDADPGFEETDAGELIKMAISYEDGGGADIKIYRNGELIGDYAMGVLGTWPTGDAEVIFGKRHFNNATNASPGDLDALIEEARIYGIVLSENEIKGLEVGGAAVELEGKLTTLWGAIKAK